MQFNPLTNELYTSKGEIIKKLNCPYAMQWDTLHGKGTPYRECSKCSHLIIDTAFFTEEELLHALKNNPDTCLKIDLNQHNITIEHYAILGKK